MVFTRTILLSTALVLLLGTGCRQSPSTGGTAPEGTGPAPAPANVTLNGAGSTFVYPLMSRWSSEYQKLVPTVLLNYQSIGSGGGIRQLIARTVQMGATDGPMTDEQLTEAKSPVLHIPLVMGAVVPTYSLAELAHPIRFTPEVLAGIFLGDIKAWNDPKIASTNADLKLPSTPIVVVHRSDGSGTTYVWVDYLSKVSQEWKTKVGTATSVNWPVGLGGKGNEGVAGTVRQTPGSIGYVELTYAIQNKMPVGSIKNAAGNFVEPSIQAVTAAAAGGLSTIPEDLRYSITNSPGDTAWPVSGTTWAVIYKDMPAGPERKALVGFLRWAIHAGQAFCAPLDYAPLPSELVQRADAKLALLEPAAK
ncbi:MAG: phosphate ABC transporter substrate-binding protein PstS [Polyangiaceae bacterium]|nr:phosphate ABC transporter substrate-binding protein PstS [Polyangiaceae bacterium]